MIVKNGQDTYDKFCFYLGWISSWDDRDVYRPEHEDMSGTYSP